jgi:hypothetical protein
VYRKAMQGISHYSYPYLKQQKPSVLFINIYTLSSTKLEIRAEQFLLKGGGGGERERVERVWEGAGEGGRDDPFYAHMNKRNKKNNNVFHNFPHILQP